MSMAAESYKMPEMHDAILRKLLNIEVGPELPVELKRVYLLRKMLADRATIGITESDLIGIAIEYGVGLPNIDDQKRDFLDVIKENPVPLGTAVLVRWRFGKDVSGKYQGTKKGKVLVLLDDDTGQVRALDPQKVKLAE